jgi:probable rRNA maturation factor
MITVLFSIESHYKVNRNRLRASIVQTLEGVVKRDTEVSVSVVGDRMMRRLNKQYRNLDKTTDVLSFPLSDNDGPTKPVFVDPPDNILRLGDIIISYPQTIKEATEQNKLVDDMMVELALHGLNHLLGIHHPE